MARKIDVDIDDSWQDLFSKEFEKTYFLNLLDDVNKLYQEQTCYPPKSLIFNAFKLCSYSNLKVVIIGQDPYHGLGQAHGLSFSVQDGIKHPPSLVNIYKELCNNYQFPYPQSGNLSPWSLQGVLLLNATLTVSEGQPNSHQKLGWEVFTDELIRQISNHKEHIVFMLWGGFAQKKIKLIDTKKHLVLSCGHPSPLSANKGLWFGNEHFKKANEYLKSKHNQTIDWKIL